MNGGNTPMAATDTHEGWLRKRGRINTAFKLRWMRLADGSLDYFTQAAATLKRKGSIGLRGASVELSAAGGYQIQLTPAGAARWSGDRGVRAPSSMTRAGSWATAAER